MRSAIVVGIFFCLGFLTHISQTPSEQVIEFKDQKTQFGELKSLPSGVVHYNYLKAKSAKAATVILLHGQGEFQNSWSELRVKLNEKQFDVLSFDLYQNGRSYSSFDIEKKSQYREQLTELLEELNVSSPILIIGKELGAEIAADFARNYPTLVRKLVLLGSDENQPVSNWLAQAPVFNQYFRTTTAKQFVKKMGRVNKATLMVWNGRPVGKSSTDDSEVAGPNEFPDGIQLQRALIQYFAQ